jgi:uncharacterized protein (TIGR03083 family)
MPADAAELADLDPFDLLDLESSRVDRFWSGLDEAGWARPTRCTEWSVRDLLGHLAMLEDYNRAGLDFTVNELFVRARGDGANGLDGFNAWGVRLRADRSAADVLAEWRTANAAFRREIRERGRDGTMDTSVGSYPSWLQAFYLAHEYATHADDMDAPVDLGEATRRTQWRARFTRYALGEYDRPVSVTVSGGVNLVRGEGSEAQLTDDELVEAGVARLPAGHPLPASLRAALACLA